MLLNLLHPTRGAAFVLGGVVGDPAVSARIGYLPEETYLYRYLTARETLDFYGRIFGLPAQVRKNRVETLLEMVGLSGMGNRQIGTFSKGMARRIGLAQALINDPDLLILDEPTSGMDPLGTRQMKDLFVELARRGKTILLCSHLLADVEDVCDRIGILYGGRMQIEGTVRELLQQKNELQMRSRQLSNSTITKIQQIAAEDGAELSIENPMDKLETFFVKIVSKARDEKQRTSGAEAGTGITGFLADKPVVRSETILDKLVSADVRTQPVESAASTARTVAPTPPLQPADTDSGLLDQLTRQKLETKATETTEENAQTDRPEPSKILKPTVNKDVLEDLISKKKDGATEITRPESREDKDA
jgi:ABC-2 type transport system ATP-binding protein